MVAAGMALEVVAATASSLVLALSLVSALVFLEDVVIVAVEAEEKKEL